MKTGGAGTVQLLIAHHADVNAENKIGRTPLKMATLLSNQTEQISILKANGGALSAMEVSSAATATAKAIEDRGGTPAGSVFRVVDCADARRNGTYRASTQRNKDGKFTEDGKFGYQRKQTFCSTTRPSSTIYWNELYKNWATNGGRWTGTDGWYNTQDTDTPPTSGWLNGDGVHARTSEPATMEIVYL